MRASENLHTSQNPDQQLETSPAGWQPSLAVVASLLAIAVLTRSALAAWTIRSGFVEYNADGFSRIIRGWEWLQAPRWEVEVWLPLHFWIYGSILAVWENVYLAPRTLNFFLSILTIILIYGIGARLADRRTGLIAAGLVAVFPYEVWLSLSGMSEPLFHVLIAFTAFGLVSWWTGQQEWLLVLAGVALAAATAVRYEAWFYAATFVPLVIGAGWYFRRSLRYPAIASILALSFMGLWIQQNHAQFDDPFAFVRATEEIRFVEDPANVEAGFVDRITFFPRRAIEVAPLMLPLGIVALSVALYRHPLRWAGFAAMIVVQAVIFVGLTAPFASLGPGGERFLLSNILLLSVPIGAAASSVVRAYRIRGMMLAGTVVAAILVTFVPDWFNPPTHYPADDTRDLAFWIGDELGAERDGIAIVLLPEMPDERFNEGYAFRVMSEHPHRVEITNAPSRLYEAVQQGEALVWVMDSRIETREPPALERAERGAYIAGTPPPPALATSGQDQLTIGDSLSVTGQDFQPGESISTWWTAPDGEVYAGPELESDREGSLQATDVPLPAGANGGVWSLTLAGQESLRQAFVSVEVVQ